MTMLDHMTLTVSDLARSKAFFLGALAPLGHGVIMEFPGVVGLGSRGRPFFWIHPGRTGTDTVHVAFQCSDRKAVDAFHAAALEAGGKDNGAPGLRAHYHPAYYGAFVLDPDGNNIEAVCHTPE
jgi:catechol 2,3-dioxygenase-like lactoylglutathione lyase family enzyme